MKKEEKVYCINCAFHEYMTPDDLCWHESQLRWEENYLDRRRVTDGLCYVRNHKNRCEDFVQIKREK